MGKVLLFKKIFTEEHKQKILFLKQIFSQDKMRRVYVTVKLDAAII